jgi:prolyl oligopeptidase
MASGPTWAGADLPDLIPPPPARRDAVVDVLHGTSIADPYRWLEDGDDPEVREWTAAQNIRTRQALDARPDRARWLGRLVALLGLPVSRGVRVCGNRVFTLDRAGGAPQHRLVLHEVGRRARVLVDPSKLTRDATSAIDWYHPSPDGRLVAYGISEGGDERSVLRVLDVDTGEVLPVEIPDTRAASVAWLPGNDGFLYTRYPAGDEYHRHVRRHIVGRPADGDDVVWSEPDVPEAWPDVAVSRDGRFTLVTVLMGWSRTDLHLHDASTGTWRTLLAGTEAVTAARFDGDRLIATTTLDAPRGRVVSIPLDGAAAPDSWATLVPESEAVLNTVVPLTGGFLLASTQRAVARLTRHDTTGALVHEIDTGEPSTLLDLDADGDVAVVQLEGFTRPGTSYWVEGPGLSPVGPTAGASDGPPPMTVTQETYRSADGTSVGLFVVHRADVTPSADTPCILTGYGGFAIAETPLWSPLAAAWCEAGGMFAVAGLRGGLEEGEAWHHAGRRQHKQNVFDDFHAAADHLVATGRTSRDRLGIRGGSNGGLLVGAALTQRPDLARAVHCAVPLLDMVRYPQFLIARLWTDEYGDPDVAEELQWLLAYSPYHHVRDGVCYPAVLLTTAEGDSRVDPLHARKMAAALQLATSCPHERPVLLHEEERAGHGIGKPLHKQGDEAADVLAFFCWQLGVTP